MEFIDLKAQHKRIEARIRERIDAVLEHGRFIMGPEIAELEKRLAERIGTRHCLTCASGTMALELVLQAWDIGPGDALFTTPLTFIATSETIARTGATPVFVDISLQDYNLNAALLENAVRAVLTGDSSLHPLPEAARQKQLRPKAIVAVDLFGHPADYGTLLSLADKYNLLVLEDGAQSYGGTYKDRPLCACGCHAATTSFFPAKPLGCYGDGGAVFTDDDQLAALMDSLRYHGRVSPQNKNDNIRLGTNGRMDTLQAAIVLAKLEIFDEELQARQTAAARYADLLSGVTGLELPAPPAQGLSTWAQYTVLLPERCDRERVMTGLKQSGIPTAINYPKSLHVQTAFQYLGYQTDDFPVAHMATGRVLSLPMHPYLDAETQARIASALVENLA
ncbi:DegT/DnrJ/EryC1/StrS family aminotransferase [Desulfovibrio sp. OttesenSCG-928-M16]|nr:DegT/DnrJ/EryC1/StrS family aminotransferase [Desulfovibrio sp. OttesenSCG-928-M16]